MPSARNIDVNILRENAITLWEKISYKNKLRFYLLLLFTIILSIFEAASLGSLVPFLTAITSPEIILENSDLIQILSAIGIETEFELARASTALFVSLALITAFLRFFLLKLQYSFAHSSSNDIALSIFDKTINQEYVYISLLNSADLTSALSQKITQLINSAIMPFLLLISSCCVACVLILGLLIIDWRLTLFLVSAFASVYSLIFLAIKKRISVNSSIMNSEYNILLKSIQETFGGIREVILGNHKEIVKTQFRKSVTNLRTAQASTLFLAASPRIVIEVSVFVLVALVAYYSFFQNGSAIVSIPTLGALAYAAQRLMPVLQLIYANRVSILGSKDVIQDLCDLINSKSPQTDEKSLAKSKVDSHTFKDKIVLKDLSFKYPETHNFALKNINLTINSGERIGIFGKTGSGKSTLLDIIMGLLHPTIGEMYCDDISYLDFSRKDWFAMFSHVPQSIFLADTSVINNIAGLGDRLNINEEKVFTAARIANIKDDIENLDDGFETVVGERGVRLSGGQLQRIGIARAIYNQSRILVLDEATSAIDPVVEAKIESSLNELNEEITVIKVAHRISTLEGCDIIHEVVDGEIVRSGKYESLFL